MAARRRGVIRPRTGGTGVAGGSGPPHHGRRTRPGKRWLRFLPATLIAAAVLLLSLGPGVFPDPGAGLPDRLSHASAYAVLSMALFAAMDPASGPRRNLRLVVVSAALVGAGALIEVIQGFMGRDADAFDAIANTVGIAVALLIWRTALPARLSIG